MAYTTDRFFEFLYQREMEGKQTLLTCPAAELAEHKEQKRRALRKALGLDKLQAISAEHPSSYQKVGSSRAEDFLLEEYEGEFLPELTVPFYIVRPAQPNGKAMLYCHGHGNRGCRAALSDRSRDTCLPLRLAELGYTVFVPEMVGIGQVVKEHFPSNDPSTCYPNAVLLQMYGISLSGVRVHEAMTLAGWIQTNFGFDRLGIYGVSGGGQCALFTAALDDRFGAAVVAAYGNLFHDSIMAMRHCVDNYVPGLLTVGECPEIMALAAPKPLLLTNGDHDPIFPLSGTLRAIEEVGAAYERFGVGERFESEIFDGGHEISLEKVFAFLQANL